LGLWDEKLTWPTPQRSKKERLRTATQWPLERRNNSVLHGEVTAGNGKNGVATVHFLSRAESCNTENGEKAMNKQRNKKVAQEGN